jgi:hypothetical protein
MFKEGRTGRDHKTYQLSALCLTLGFATLYLSPAPAGLSPWLGHGGACRLMAIW